MVIVPARCCITGSGRVMTSAVSCIGIAEPSMTSTSKTAAIAFSFRFKKKLLSKMYLIV